ARGGALLLGAVLDRPDVRQPHREAVNAGDHEVLELPRVAEAPQRAQRQLAPAGVHVPARDLGVLALERGAYRRDRDPIGREAVHVDADVHGALETADDRDLAHTQRALD